MKIISDDRIIKIEIYKSDSCPFWNSNTIQNILKDKNYPARKNIKKIKLIRETFLEKGNSWLETPVYWKIRFQDLEQEDINELEETYKFSLREEKLKRICI
jgi:hypothetical protein